MVKVRFLAEFRGSLVEQSGLGPVLEVVAQNLAVLSKKCIVLYSFFRRHLTTSQRAALAVTLMDRLDLREKAEERRIEGNKLGATINNGALPSNEGRAEQDRHKQEATAQAAKLTEVSRSSVERADKARRQGTPED